MGTKKKTAAVDPLIAAVIAKLPSAGDAWPAGERRAWLHMMDVAFGVVYGATDTDIVDLPAPIAAPRLASGGVPRFFIDHNGVARRDPGGVPIRAADIPSDERIEDERPQALRDIETIQWADGLWPAAALPSLNFG